MRLRILLPLPLSIAALTSSITGGCTETKSEAKPDAGSASASSSSGGTDEVSPPTVEDDAGVKQDGTQCPSIAHDDDFEREAVESPAWKLISGKATTLALDGTTGINAKSLHVSLADGPAPRFGFLERGLPNTACRVTVSFKLRVTTLPPEGSFVDVARIVVAGGLLSVRLNGSNLVLIEHGIAPNEDVIGDSASVIKALTAEEVLGIAVILDRRSTPPKIGISTTEAAPSTTEAKYVLGAPRFLALGSAGANTGPNLEYRIDDVRIR